MRPVGLQHDGAGLLQVPLVALQQLHTLSSGSQPQTKQLLHLERRCWRNLTQVGTVLQQLEFPAAWKTTSTTVSSLFFVARSFKMSGWLELSGAVGGESVDTSAFLRPL
ncbi:hypothetical protein CHARACLAT_027334 [Characodon lateralis]|uniref:Uncharacterized protein n=1 Tax=Characodon lateralis TaxID=208331 RepID=A0ABU7E4A2_9TELE|nr:hypothetical protein [Characodon lateralis]